MISQLDRSLFPDRCEVLEVTPSQRYLYVIFKNGHSSLLYYQIKNNCRVFINQQIKKIDNIDVIIRNPQDRLVSGINTYIQHTLRNNPTLDRTTVEWFAQNYLYLDRHYCLQFSWLLNLARYLQVDAKLNFLSMTDIDTIVPGINLKPDGIVEAPSELINQVALIKGNEMYQRIDTAIFECIGQSMTFKELLQHIKNSDPAAYDYVIGYAQQILSPTYALS
jgi:hypothetical protein